MRANLYPPYDLLAERLHYDPETGIVTWKANVKWTKEGAEAGCVATDGYRVIRVNRKNYYAHRIAFTLHHGADLDPEVIVDHKNGIKTDNRICNLRLVTPSENILNQSKKSNNLAGRTGVYYKRDKNKFEARITLNSVRHHLGSYDYIEDAIAARERAEQEHNIFTRE